jgi:hypothetical protein
MKSFRTLELALEFCDLPMKASGSIDIVYDKSYSGYGL